MSLVELDDAERSRIITALLTLASQQENAARGHTLAGPAWKDTRAIVRENARNCRVLAEKIKAASQ